MSHFVKEAKLQPIKNAGFARWQNRAAVAGAMLGGKFNEVEDPTVRPSKHYFFHEEVEKPNDPKPPAQDQASSVPNLIPSQNYHKLTNTLNTSTGTSKSQLPHQLTTLTGNNTLNNAQ